MSPKPPSKEQIEKVLEATIRLGSTRAAARDLGMAPGTAYDWVTHQGPRLYGLKRPPDLPSVKGRRYIEVTEGVGYVGGDAHYWPSDRPSTAHRAFVKFIKKEKHLAFVCMNGDAHDFPNISRHDGDWFKTPSTQEEMEEVDERLTEIVKASGKARRFFSRGNHDIRFDRYLAKNAPEMRGISGMCIDDRLPLWDVCWSLWVNDGPGGCVIKHRPPKGGFHSTTNSPLWSGRSTVCNHLHALQVRPLTDYNGTRWGVDAGCLADVYGPQFSYLEDAVRSWRGGFARLKWINGALLTPEIVRVVSADAVEFRGEIIEV